jgi:hypothetical protein
MRFVFQTLFIIILALALELFLPWWSIAIAAFAFGYLLNSKANFAAGFIAILLLWFFKSLLIDLSSSTDLVERIASILAVDDKYLLMIVTGSVGGLVGGFAALTGSILKQRKRRYYY